MNANRYRSNAPTPLTLADRNRQRVALAQHEARQRAARRGEHIKAFAAVALVVGLAVVFFVRLTSGV